MQWNIWDSIYYNNPEYFPNLKLWLHQSILHLEPHTSIGIFQLDYSSHNLARNDNLFWEYMPFSSSKRGERERARDDKVAKASPHTIHPRKKQKNKIFCLGIFLEEMLNFSHIDKKIDFPFKITSSMTLYIYFKRLFPSILRIFLPSIDKHSLT